MRERLYEDHENAKYLAENLSSINGLQIVNQVDTNIIVADVKGLHIDSAQFVEKLMKEGVLAGTFGSSYVRFVTHYDVSRKEIDTAIAAIQITAG